MIAHTYPGWALKDIKKFSRRERTNWLEMAKVQGKVVRS